MILQKNKKYFSLLFALFCLATACQDNSPTQQLLLEEDKLVDVICDLQIAEAMLDTEAMEVRDSIMKIYYPQILEKHHIQKADLDTTLTRLGRQPALSSRIFEKVQKKLKDLSK